MCNNTAYHKIPECTNSFQRLKNNFANYHLRLLLSTVRYVRAIKLMNNIINWRLTMSAEGLRRL